MTETAQTRWNKRNPDKIRVIKARYRAKHPKRVKAWDKANPEQKAYNSQKSRAKVRGIDFLLSFKDWREWWGTDYVNRGKAPGKLCMCRVGDAGAYQLDNIYKATWSQNRRDRDAIHDWTIARDVPDIPRNVA